MKSIEIGSSLSRPVVIGPDGEMVLISGPCVIESRELCLEIGEYLKQLCEKNGIGYVFKASFDKANRTSVSSFRGPGLEEGLKILGEIREELGVPVLSDIHLPDQAAVAAEVLDIIQIPAFLARQTDLLVAAAKTGKPIQVKKAQFMAAADMKNVIDKITSQQNEQIILVERGSSFGYNQLICDMTSIPGMRQLGYPALIDATHSTQKPGGLGNASGGDPAMAPVLARAAMAAGADGIFIEAHPNPKRALSDAASMLRLDQMEELLCCCRDIHERVRQG